jgi:uncharacterized protein (TIRG00374 family)
LPRHRTLGRAAGTLLVGGACVAYLVWKIDLVRTSRILERANLPTFAAAVAITVGALLPLSWRWQRLLAARGVHDNLAWLTRTYLTSYAFAQVLPTSLGGDATRIVSGARRHRGAASVVTGSVVLERALGGFATLALAAVGFALAVGRYDVGPYLWLELAILAGALLALVLLFSPGALRPLAPILRRAHLERPARAVYEGLSGYRPHRRVLAWAFALTLVVQSFRVVAIWLVARSVGVHLSPRPFFVLGPLLFLVMLVPFTLNGIAVREAFFVSFLAKLHVPADPAFATGFLFYLLSIATGVPGALLLLLGAVGGRRKDIAPVIRT